MDYRKVFLDFIPVKSQTKKQKTEKEKKIKRKGQPKNVNYCCIYYIELTPIPRPLTFNWLQFLGIINERRSMTPTFTSKWTEQPGAQTTVSLHYQKFSLANHDILTRLPSI